MRYFKKKYKIDEAKAINIFWLELYHFMETLRESKNEFIYRLKPVIASFREYEVREMIQFNLKNRKIDNDDSLKKEIINIVRNLEISKDHYIDEKNSKNKLRKV